MFRREGNSIERASKCRLAPGACNLQSKVLRRKNRPIFGFAEALALGFGFVMYPERNSNIGSRKSCPEYTTPGVAPPGRTTNLGNVSTVNSLTTEVCVSRA